MKNKQKIRSFVQACATCLSNGYLIGFLQMKIYKGSLKKTCVPGLNCYSCPGALGSCPIGSLQAVLGNRQFYMTFYVFGFLMMVGALFGRIVCGWLCPFGWIQDLLHKIPSKNKYKTIWGDCILRYLKYAILVVFVILMPLFVVDIVGQGAPWFCKLICPAGTLEGGIPLVSTSKDLRQLVGFLFLWKNFILFGLLIVSVFVYRPFCHYLCPLGAIYGLFNPIAFGRFQVEQSKCTGCKSCQKACKFNIPVYDTPNSPECIRCGLCISTCQKGCIQYENNPLVNKKQREKNKI